MPKLSSRQGTAAYPALDVHVCRMSLSLLLSPTDCSYLCKYHMHCAVGCRYCRFPFKEKEVLNLADFLQSNHT